MKKFFFGGDLSYKDFIVRGFKGINFELSNNLNDKLDLIYWVYGGGPDLLEYWKLWLKSKPFIIIHWIGTDVLVWMNKINNSGFKSRIYYRIWRYLINRRNKAGTLLNIAGADWLREELLSIHIDSITLPITTIDKELILKTESNNLRNYDFVSYVPFNRFEFYGGGTIIALAKLMPQYKFILIFPDLLSLNIKDEKEYPSNVKLLSKLSFDEYQQVLSESKCFLRFTKHDGLSLSVLEALLYGLQVCWTHKFPFVHNINLANESIEQLSERLSVIIENWNKNIEGREFIIKYYSIESFENNFENIFEIIK